MRRTPWVLLGAAHPGGLLIVAGFLGTTPYGWQMFAGGVVLLIRADAVERR